MFKKTLILCLSGAAGLLADDAFSVFVDKAILGPGETATLTAVSSTTAGADPKVNWAVASALRGAEISKQIGQETLSYTAPAQINRCGQVAVTATLPAKPPESHTVYLSLVPPEQQDIVRELCTGSSIVISVLGIEKASATSSDSDPKFFFDLFRSSPLPIEKSTGGPKAGIYGPPWRWWGDVRIATYPQQISVPVSQFAGQFAQQLGNVPVNQLAQYGEFRTGLERRIAGFLQYFVPEPGAAYERTSLGAVFYFGGQASLSNPTRIAQVFEIPAQGTPQRAAFDRAFPVSKYPDLALGPSYIGLTPPDRDHAFWQYGAGFRLTTRFFDPSGGLISAPAMVSASFGQNELITGGKRRGVVGDFEGFYPLPMGIRTKDVATIYLFGRANLRLGGASPLEMPLALKPAFTGTGSQTTPVQITDPGVAIIAFPSNRDTYAIGVGADAVQIVKNMMNLGKSQ